jgi:Ribosomal L29 protein.
MKKEAINELSTADLMERIEATREQYIKMKMQHAVSPLDNPNKSAQPANNRTYAHRAHKASECRKER